MQLDLPKTFSQYMKRVVDPILAYRLDHKQSRLIESIEVLRQLPHHGEPAQIFDQLVEVKGWVLESRFARLQRKDLEALNPGYTVRVRRSVRKELGIRVRLTRPGFLVRAEGSSELPPFQFHLRAQNGTPVGLRTSNSDAQYSISQLSSALPRQIHQQGYIDEVLQLPLPSDSDPTTWFAALVHLQPSIMLQIVDSEEGHFLAQAAALTLSRNLSSARWADKFAVVAFGRSGTYQSDLKALPVRRTDAPHDRIRRSAARLPVPERIGSTIRWEEGDKQLDAPNDQWFSVTDAVVQHGGTVITPEGLLVYENSADPAFDFVAGQWRTVFASHVNREMALVEIAPAADEAIDEAILMSGRNDENWFHWLIEYLPRVLSIPATIRHEVPLLVSSRTPATGVEALRAISDRPIRVIEADVAHTVKKLHLTAPPVQVLDTTSIPWDMGLSVNSTSIANLRKALLEGIATPPTQRRVFLVRKSRHRGVLNENRLARVALRYGLEVVDPGDLSFSEQCELFSSTSLLVGASGAVMANYVMLPPGSQVIAFTSEQLHDFVLPASLAGMAGARFTYILGKTPKRRRPFEDRNHWIHADFAVDPRDFEEALVTALAR